MEKRYNYLYKITNLINNKFYYGIHSTDNLDDGYMGSGSYLNNAYKKHGIENFKKEILEFRDTREEISDLEKEIVTEELVNNPNCYNIRLGGDEATTLGTATMKDKDGNIYQVPIGSDEYYNMVGSTTGMVAVYDIIEHKNKSVTSDEYYNNKNRYQCFSKGITVVYDLNTQKVVRITKEEFRKNKDKYQGCTFGKVCVLIDGEYKHITCEEYSKGDYQTVWSGRHHTEETKQKISEQHKKYGYQKGEKNSQYGTCCITKDGINKRIKKEELDSYLNNGWTKGLVFSDETKQKMSKKRKESNLNPAIGTCWVMKDGINKRIKKEELDSYLNDGWIKGAKFNFISTNSKSNLLDIDEIKKDIENKLTNNEFEKKYNMKMITIKRFMKKHGIENYNHVNGKNHYAYGTCWITKDGENKKIKKEELDSYLNDGWIKGRNFNPHI